MWWKNFMNDLIVSSAYVTLHKLYKNSVSTLYIFVGQRILVDDFNVMKFWSYVCNKLVIMALYQHVYFFYACLFYFCDILQTFSQFIFAVRDYTPYVTTIIKD